MLKPINEEDYQQELSNFLKIVRDDIDLSAMLLELSVISTICKEGNPAHADDALSILKAFCRNKRLLVKNVMTIVKIMLLNGATIATPQRTFSMIRRINSWLRLTMTQQRFNALPILSSNKSLVDKPPLVKITSDFIDSRPNPTNYFRVSQQRI